MKKILALLPVMLLSLLLSSCIVEEPEENHRPTRGIYEAFEYVRNANRPMLDALFITYRMQEYNRLQTDSARQAFRKTYLRDMTVKDTVSKENSFNPMYILTDRKSDYFYTQYTITDYRYNYLRIECTTYLYKTKTHRMFDVHQQSDGSWRIDDYVIHPTTSTDDSSRELYWADLFSVANRFYVWGSDLTAKWTLQDNGEPQCRLEGKIEMYTLLNIPLLIEAPLLTPFTVSYIPADTTAAGGEGKPGRLRASGTLGLNITDRGTKETEQATAKFSGKDDGRVLITARNLSEEWWY